LLTPGVVTPGDTDFANGVGISANGNRGRSNNFQIDGQDNNDNSVTGPSLSITNNEAIGEYQVITNTFSAEFGRNSGAQINVITKPGTNNFHGSLFEYFRNARMNARDNLEKKSQVAFQTLADLGVDELSGLADRFLHAEPFTENRFGGALGGPIVKEKAFFFATYERTMFRGESVGDTLGGGAFILRAEDALFLADQFGSTTLTDYTSGALSSGPPFAPVGSFLLVPPVVDTDGDGLPDAFQFPDTPGNLAPLAIVSTGGAGRRTIFGGQGLRFFSTDSTVDQLITRVDYNVTSDDRITGRYIFDDTDIPVGTGSVVSGALFPVPSRNHNLGLSYTRTISARFVNEARFNFSTLDVQFGDTSVRANPGVSFAGTRSLVPGGLLTGFGTANNLPQSRKVDTYQFQDTVTATLGSHAVKFGADIRHQNVENFFLPNFLGTYRFSSGGALPANTFFNLSGSARTTATAIENFILGRPDRISFALGNPLATTTQNDYFFFIQDDWRVRPNLTLNLGLRYEVSTTPFNPLIEQTNEREADPSRAIFNQSFGLETRTATKLPLDKNNFGPRVGFAWSPNFSSLGERFTNGRTVVRGSFGIAYDPPYFNIVLNTITAAPFAAVGTIVQVPGSATAVTYPFLPQTTAELNTTPGTNGGDPRLFNQTRVDPNLYNPYTMSWSFGVQQELYRGGVLEARYVGNRIIGQFQTINGNPDLRFLARAGDFIAGDPGLFTGGRIAPAGTQAGTSANGFATRPGTNGNGRVDPNFGLVRTRINGASSTYHGLQTRFDTRIRNQLTLNANYTFSKTLDNASEIFSTLGGGVTVAHAQNPFDITEGERGYSAFHQKHNFTSGFLWDLPFFSEQRGVVGKILGGYQINGIIRMGSGRAYTPNMFFAMYDPGWEGGFIGAGGLRGFNGNPDAGQGTIAFGATAAGAVFGVAADPGQYVIFDTLNPGSEFTIVNSVADAKQQARVIYNDFGLFTQFGIPLAALEAFNDFGTPYGDIGRNSFFGEPFYLTNLSVFKNLKLSESKSLEFRVEAFNVFNRRNFGVPDPIAEDAFNGITVSSYNNPGFNNGGNRSMRLGIRFIF
ncbi:MAG TPA: hypothetical protein VJQ56_16895, partial [Blastocatellia bacterium]|nr:hypothetical protein [Blastocatellia bacterium]